MKKVLIITSRGSAVIDWKEREVYVREFCENVENSLGSDEYQVLYSTFEELYFEVIDGKTAIIDIKNNNDLAEYDFVQLKNWSAFTGLASVAGEYLKRHNKSFSNSEVLLCSHVDKNSQMFVMGWAGLPVPNSVYMNADMIAASPEVQEKIIADLGFPLIMKDNDGSRGEKNYLVKDQARMLEILNSGEVYARSNKPVQYIFQSFVPNKGDVRVLFIGLEHDPMIFVREATNGSHLNNTSQGGTGTLVPTAEFDVVMVEQSRQAAQALGREIAGVDIIIDEQTKKHYFLEVNTTPAIATGFATEQKVDLFVEYIRHETTDKS